MTIRIDTATVEQEQVSPGSTRSENPSSAKRAIIGQPGLRSPTALLSDISTLASLSSKKRRSLHDKHIVAAERTYLSMLNSNPSPHSHRSRPPQKVIHKGSSPLQLVLDSVDTAGIPSVSLNQVNTPAKSKRSPTQSRTASLMETPAALRFLSRDTVNSSDLASSMGSSLHFEDSIGLAKQFAEESAFESSSTADKNIRSIGSLSDESDSFNDGDTVDDDSVAIVRNHHDASEGSVDDEMLAIIEEALSDREHSIVSRDIEVEDEDLKQQDDTSQFISDSTRSLDKDAGADESDDEYEVHGDANQSSKECLKVSQTQSNDGHSDESDSAHLRELTPQPDMEKDGSECTDTVCSSPDLAQILEEQEAILREISQLRLRESELLQKLDENQQRARSILSAK